MVPEPSLLSEREQRLGDVLAALLEACEHGLEPDRDQWRARYPEFVAELTEFFDSRAKVDRLTAPFRSAAAAGGAATPAPADTSSPGLETNTGADSALRPAQDFGPYELLAELGHGGMGRVYKARHKTLHRVVALKRIRAGGLASDADVRRFRNEAEAAANLDHPHIVPIYEVGEWHPGDAAAPVLYFSMKLIEGGNLADSLPRFRDDARAAARLVATIARAVHHAHQHGILHRDLKPSNILLDGADQPFVTDFGLAKQVEADSGLTRSGELVGTPSYMAPEQALGQRGAVTTATDVYGLGAVLYALLTGHAPFQANTVLETLMQVREHEPLQPRSVNSQLDKDLEIICLKCLEKQPESRYRSAQEVAEDLERYLAGEPIRARLAGRLERFGRWCRREPRLAVLAGLLVLSLLAGLGMVTWQWQRAESEARRAEVNFHIAEEQRTRAESNLVEARHQQDLAQQSFRLAHQAVKDLAVQVSEKDLAQVPGLQPLRKKLLEAALAYYQNFLKERAHDDALRADLAEAQMRVARLTKEIGSKEAALGAALRGRDLYADLVRANPASIPWQRELAHAHTTIAVLQEGIGHSAEAVASLEQARVLFEQIVRANPANLDAQGDLATNQQNLGALYALTGRPALALVQFEKACALREELVRTRANNADFQSHLSNCCDNLGTLLGMLGRNDEALKAFQRSLELRQKLHERKPGHLGYRSALANSYRNVGDWQRRNGQSAQGLETMQQGHVLVEGLAKGNPKVTYYQIQLAASHQNIGEACRRSGQTARAMASFQQARAVLEDIVRMHPSLHFQRGELAACEYAIGSLYRAGSKKTEARACFERARALQAGLVQTNPEQLDYLSALATTWAELGLLLADTSQPDEGIAALRQAIVNQRQAFHKAPQVVRYRQRLRGHYRALASLLRKLRRPADAVAATLERRALWPDDPNELFNVAGELAQAATIVARDTGEANTERRKYHALALETLRQAVAHGFHDRERIQTSRELESLRPTNEFQQLLTELTAKTKKGM
jgi:tetratricopeptide (TPR) repeat protein/tRNA A-37 threonylcarbamoyl transferase component Bud32